MERHREDDEGGSGGGAGRIAACKEQDKRGKERENGREFEGIIVNNHVRYKFLAIQGRVCHRNGVTKGWDGFKMLYFSILHDYIT